MEEARRMLKEACHVRPVSVPSWHALAKLEDRLGNTQEARRLFLQTLAFDEHEPMTYCRSPGEVPPHLHVGSD